VEINGWLNNPTIKWVLFYITIQVMFASEKGFNATVSPHTLNMLKVDAIVNQRL